MAYVAADKGSSSTGADLYTGDRGEPYLLYKQAAKTQLHGLERKLRPENVTPEMLIDLLSDLCKTGSDAQVVLQQIWACLGSEGEEAAMGYIPGAQFSAALLARLQQRHSQQRDMMVLIRSQDDYKILLQLEQAGPEETQQYARLGVKGAQGNLSFIAFANQVSKYRQMFAHLETVSLLPATEVFIRGLKDSGMQECARSWLQMQGPMNPLQLAEKLETEYANQVASATAAMGLAGQAPGNPPKPPRDGRKQAGQVLGIPWNRVSVPELQAIDGQVRPSIIGRTMPVMLRLTPEEGPQLEIPVTMGACVMEGDADGNS
ncbi:hypothetical protein OEZ85_000078 [Tetradesmus obliquus]|uniref:Uncharacterized protein n=1 Tax=Tetradesmus obliquus TaxID=3088 RepID=A0ABY8USP3_TETOB|nr:hypothetical protein OEZ85_000078 [Tetradesmus obliquus]